MRRMVFSLMAAAALLASVGAAHANGPVTLTDDQLDKATAGNLAFLMAVTQYDLAALSALTTFILHPAAGIPGIPPFNPAL